MLKVSLIDRTAWFSWLAVITAQVNKADPSHKPGGTMKIFDAGVPFCLISMTTCFRKFDRKRHPALEFLANNNTMWCHFFQNFAP